MQAPVTPSGPPVQEPDGRACPACGAANGPLAAFCWQCYRQFGAPSPQGAPMSGTGAYVARPGAPGGRPVGSAYTPGAAPGYAPSPAAETFAPPKPARSLAGMIGVLVFVVAVAAGVFVFMNKASAPTLPQSVGGLTKISDPAIDPTVEMFRSMAESQGVQADIGLYGTAGLPSAAIIWVTGADAPSDGQAFSEFAEGFNTGLGSGSLDEARRTTEVVDGISIECAPVVGEPPGSMCLWQEDDVLWMVFELSDGSLGSASDLAASVHQTVGA